MVVQLYMVSQVETCNEVPNVLRCPEWDLSPEVPRPGDFEWSVIAMCDSYAGRGGLFVKRTVQIQGGS